MGESMAKHKRKRDFQKRKVYRLGWSLPHGETYESIEDARRDLNRMWLELADLLEVTPRLSTVPALVRPAPQRTSKSIYSPSKHHIVCAVGMLYQRKLIHELCHGLNTYWDGKYRRTCGASHGSKYTTIYIFALAVYMFDGDFDHVEQVAQEHGCKYDSSKLQELVQIYQKQNIKKTG